MRKPAVAEEKIIRLTLENVRSFYNRDKAMTTSYMTDDFMWIGSNDFQWCEGLDDFCRVTKKEYEEPPVMLTDEEYHMLFHEKNVWVVYGRYQATAVLEDGSVIHAHVRGTYVWRRIKGELKLAHVHGSHAQDIPLNRLAPKLEAFTEETDFFAYMKRIDSAGGNGEKITFRDRDKKYRYLFPSEIIYLKACGQYSIVYTKTDRFQVCGLLAEYEKNLPQLFRRIHKSYLVNSLYIDGIYRYRATLRDGQELPVGKDRYMDLKRYLQQGCVHDGP